MINDQKARPSFFLSLCCVIRRFSLHPNNTLVNISAQCARWYSSVWWKRAAGKTTRTKFAALRASWGWQSVATLGYSLLVTSWLKPSGERVYNTCTRIHIIAVRRHQRRTHILFARNSILFIYIYMGHECAVVNAWYTFMKSFARESFRRDFHSSSIPSFGACLTTFTVSLINLNYADCLRAIFQS